MRQGKHQMIQLLSTLYMRRL